MNTQTRNAKILSMRGMKSYGLIAKELGISRSTVAGVMFRADYPSCARVPSPNSKSGNKIGTGHYGGGHYAKELLPKAHAGGTRA